MRCSHPLRPAKRSPSSWGSILLAGLCVVLPLTSIALALVLVAAQALHDAWR